MTLTYWITFEPDDNDTLLVRCPQLPVVVTYGATEEAAMRNAVDAIEIALAFMLATGDEIPLPDDQRHGRGAFVTVTAPKGYRGPS